MIKWSGVGKKSEKGGHALSAIAMDLYWPRPPLIAVSASASDAPHCVLLLLRACTNASSFEVKLPLSEA